MTASEELIVRSDGGPVTTLMLNRGDRFNPLSLEMIAQLRTQLVAVAGDPTIRMVVLAAAGRGFCAGHDLRELREHAGDTRWLRQLFDDCAALMLDLTRLPQPVVARVHGLASAAGCQLVSMCDLAIASTTAQFALPGVNIGLFCSTPAVGAARNLPRKPLMEMLLTGAPIDAMTALRRGLVNQVVAPDELDAAIARYGRTIRERSAAVIAAGKRVFYRQTEMGLEDAYELAGAAMVDHLGLPDAVEGIAAFIDKRAPRWLG